MQYNVMRKEPNGTMEPEPMVRKHVSDSQMAAVLDRRHLEDVTNYQESSPSDAQTNNNSNRTRNNNKLVIDEVSSKLDPVSFSSANLLSLF